MVAAGRLRYESYRGFRGGSDLVRTFLGAVSVDPDPADLLEVLEVLSDLRAACRKRHCWHIDETYVKVAGAWCYLYRAIDRDGNLVDV